MTNHIDNVTGEVLFFDGICFDRDTNESVVSQELKNTGIYFGDIVDNESTEQKHIPHIVHNGVVFTAGPTINITQDNSKVLSFNKNNKTQWVITDIKSNPLSKSVTAIAQKLDLSDIYAKIEALETLISTSEPQITTYYWYLGSSNNAVNDGDNPTALNTNYSGWHTATSMPTWNNQLGSEIGVDAAQDDYTWVIMPTEWYENLTVKTAIDSTIDWGEENKWQITNNGIQYTAVWADVTANGLYFTLNK